MIAGSLKTNPPPKDDGLFLDWPKNDWIAARVPRPTTPDPAEIIDKAAERAMRSLENESYYREVGGVLLPPEPAISVHKPRYEPHGTPSLVQSPN
jgi:hypothetical protein